MALRRDLPVLRTDGLVILDDETLVRFGTTEPHQVIKSALASCDLYDRVLEALNRPHPQAVLACSCFAVVPPYTPQRLAAGTEYVSYHTLRAGQVRDLGYELWATDTFAAGEPDDRNAVHFDLVVGVLPIAAVAARTGSHNERRRLRAQLRPRFDPLLDALRGPHRLPEHDERYP